MTKTIGKIFALLITVSTLVVTGCGPAAPTLDANAVYTEAAQTVAAQLTQTSLAMPMATSTPEPTQPPPTATLPVSTDTPIVLVSPTPQTIITLAFPTMPVNIATPTSPASGLQYGDHAKYLYVVPIDGTVMSPGQAFRITVGFQNTGTNPWSTETRLAFVGGTSYSQNAFYPLTAVVEPGEKAEFYLDAYAPTTPGSYNTIYSLISATGAVMAQFNLVIVVSN